MVCTCWAWSCAKRRRRISASSGSSSYCEEKINLVFQRAGRDSEEKTSIPSWNFEFIESLWCVSLQRRKNLIVCWLHHNTFKKFENVKAKRKFCDYNSRSSFFRTWNINWFTHLHNGLSEWILWCLLTFLSFLLNCRNEGRCLWLRRKINVWK
jgi:hypothetical protein